MQILSNLKSEYIETCAEFKRGEKVEVSFRNGTKKEAFIGNISVDFNNKLKYDFHKVKNDGTASQHHHHFYIYESVKSLEKTDNIPLDKTHSGLEAKPFSFIDAFSKKPNKVKDYLPAK